MKTDDEDKYQPLKRIAGVLTAPVSGSLSQKVRDEIFGMKFQDSFCGIHRYRASFAEKFACTVSILSNLAMPYAVVEMCNSSSENFLKAMYIYEIYKIGETLYRAGEFLFKEGENSSGSIEGTLVSKICIEPFLKKEKK